MCQQCHVEISTNRLTILPLTLSTLFLPLSTAIRSLQTLRSRDIQKDTRYCNILSIDHEIVAYYYRLGPSLDRFGATRSHAHIGKETAVARRRSQWSLGTRET